MAAEDPELGLERLDEHRWEKGKCRRNLAVRGWTLA